MNLEFYRDKKILITGHTGFKGSWMCKALLTVHADIVGYALAPNPSDSLYELSGVDSLIRSYIGDICDLEKLEAVFEKEQPEIVIHMAAQPLVREAYIDPVNTYKVNVMGTVNVMECVRKTSSVKSVVNVTTDKVYENKEWEWGYRENETLNGYDPYSNSKSCSELVTSSYIKSFFDERKISVSTARAGNVIGGGDFAKDRIIPDCVKAAIRGERIRVRNKNSIRPYQHVLEPIFAYLLIAARQYDNKELAGAYNVGPSENDSWTTQMLADTFCKIWNQENNENVIWYAEQEDGPHEANFLKLDCSHIKNVLRWDATWNVETAMHKVVEWYTVWNRKEDVAGCMERQIVEFMNNI